jgi:hypothetical protein
MNLNGGYLAVTPKRYAKPALVYEKIKAAEERPFPPADLD